MAAGRDVGLRRPGLRRAFDPADGGDAVGGETRIGDTVTNPRLKVVGHDDMGMFWDDGFGIGIALGDGHRGAAFKYGELEIGVDEGGEDQGDLPIGTVVSLGQNSAGNVFTQFRLKAGTSSFLDFYLTTDGATSAVQILTEDSLELQCPNLRLNGEITEYGNRVVNELYPVDLATTGPLDLATDLAVGAGKHVDGVAISYDGMRILVKDQTDPIENGIYLTTHGAAVREPEGVLGIGKYQGARVRVKDGTTHWMQTFVNTDRYIATLGPTGNPLNPGDPIHFVPLKTFLEGSAAVTSEDITDASFLGKEILTAGTPGEVRTALDLVPGVNVQEHDAELDALAGLASAANKVPYFTGAGAAALADFTAAGRALAGAADATAQRLALGLTDLSDDANNELAHANSVCGFDFPSLMFEMDTVGKIGTLGNRWTALLGGTGAVSIAQSGIRGGGNTLTTGAGANGYVQMISCVNGLAAYGSAMMDDLIAATSKWHVETVFKLTSTPDAQTEVGVGWIAPDGTSQPLIGVRGAQSTTKFRCFVFGSSTGVNSTVNVDTNFHRFKMWGNGDGKVYFSVDGEAAIQFTGYVTSKPAAPFAALLNNTTAAAQVQLLGRTRYRVNGLVAA